MRSAARLFLALRCALAFPAAVAAQALARPAFPPGIQPLYREIGDWIIVCDNTRQCVAKYLLGDHDDDTNPYDEDAGIVIARAAGPAGDLTVDVTAGSSFDPNTIRIDDAMPRRRPKWERFDENRGASIDDVDALSFVREMRDAKAVSWSGKGRGSRVPLRGLAAVLIAMDEAQGRIGNVSALGRPGPRSATTTPAPVLPPTVTLGPKPSPLAKPDALARSVRRLQGPALAAHDCDREAGVGDSADPLDASSAIVLLGCGRFAYQTSVLAFIVPRADPGKARLLMLPDPLPSAPLDLESRGEYVEGSYDAASRVFGQYAKGRGMADCGSAQEWTYDGTDFRLSFYTLQQRCGGGSGDWPTLFRTRVQPSSKNGKSGRTSLAK
jgi:hypothetical protein